MKYTVEEQSAHRAEFVKALRSGKYEQGKGRLRTKDDKFCCLGVACDVMGTEWKLSDEGYQDSYFNMMPPEAKNYFGMATYGDFDKEKFLITDNVGIKQYALWSLNDMHNYNFNQIADIIEGSEEYYRKNYKNESEVRE